VAGYKTFLNHFRLDSQAGGGDFHFEARAEWAAPDPNFRECLRRLTESIDRNNLAQNVGQLGRIVSGLRRLSPSLKVVGVMFRRRASGATGVDRNSNS
jgi:hypothetical protein